MNVSLFSSSCMSTPLPQHTSILEEKDIDDLSIDLHTDYPWLQDKKISRILLYHSSLSVKKIERIIDYIKNYLGMLVQNSLLGNGAVHLRSDQTNLAVSIDISESGRVFLALKSSGSLIGSGSFRKSKIAIMLSDPDLPIIARSTEKFSQLAKKIYADSELCILYKIACFLEEYPQITGLLRFYDYVDYHPKTAVKTNEVGGYDPVKPSAEIIGKRMIATKYYNKKSLADCLDDLSLRNKLKIALHILIGLSHLHDLEIFHSDIKLENIFIAIDESTGQLVEAVIGDFGFACDLTNPFDCFFKNSDFICRAPEIGPSKISMGSPIDKKILACDIYSMGLVLQELFSDFAHPILFQFICCMLDTNPQNRHTAREAKNFYAKIYMVILKEKRNEIFPKKIKENSQSEMKSSLLDG